MNKEDKYFKDIKLEGNHLNKCELIYKGEDDLRRLYVVKNEDGFSAHAVEFNSCMASEQKDDWKNETLIVNTIFEVIALYDGVRHLTFSPETDGYLYYPGMEDIIVMLQKLRELELEVCNEKL